MNITLIGVGYVGLVTGLVFSEKTHQVNFIDIDTKKIELLKDAKVPFYEPQIEGLLIKNFDLLTFHTSLSQEISSITDIYFVCVGTPRTKEGQLDTKFVMTACREIVMKTEVPVPIVIKSTVPVGTCKRVWNLVNGLKDEVKENWPILFNPEFLREGNAVYDSFYPERIVIGTENKEDKSTYIIKELYRDWQAPLIICDLESAELIKLASNGFLATKISYINELAKLSEVIGVDIKKVTEGMGLDSRIGKKFLQAGVGYGGSCFPKDVESLIITGKNVGQSLTILEAVQEVNYGQRNWFINKIKNILDGVTNKTIGILGLSFKPNTDDLRYAPSLTVIPELLKKGAKIKVYDPKAMGNIRDYFTGVICCSNSYEVAKDSDCIVILTEWEEFKNLSLEKLKTCLKRPIIIDGRNVFEPARMKEYGFIYEGVGRRNV